MMSDMQNNNYTSFFTATITKLTSSSHAFVCKIKRRPVQTINFNLNFITSFAPLLSLNNHFHTL